MSVVNLVESCMCGSRVDLVGGTVFVEHQAQLFREAHATCRERLTAPIHDPMEHWYNRLPMEGEEE